ncbi:hypothetical protein BH23CHL2_BH23CHL2_30580 [soil metagenome]
MSIQADVLPDHRGLFRQGSNGDALGFGLRIVGPYDSQEGGQPLRPGASTVPIFLNLSLPVSIGILVVVGVVIGYAGSRMVGVAEALSARTGNGWEGVTLLLLYAGGFTVVFTI